MSDDRAELLAAIREKAVVRGDFVLSSGQRASWYVDLRRILLDGRVAPLAGRVMLDLTADLGYQAAGGLTLGADPVATAIMHASASRGTHSGSACPAPEPDPVPARDHRRVQRQGGDAPLAQAPVVRDQRHAQQDRAGQQRQGRRPRDQVGSGRYERQDDERGHDAEQEPGRVVADNPAHRSRAPFDLRSWRPR